MISQMEIDLLSSLRDRLQLSEDSDQVREGKALEALLEAHAQLKKPHVQALAQVSITLGNDREANLKAIASNLDIAVEAAGSDAFPDQSHKEALKAAARTASAAILQAVSVSQ